MRRALKRARSAIRRAGQHIRFPTSSGSQGQNSRTVSDRGSSSAGPVGEEATSSNTAPVLLLDSQIQTRNQDETDLLRRLHTKPIGLTKCFDEKFLIRF
ncbi:hypothetical protein U9M48_013999 [Paspalum notatum var. saurae]|uniref:Uncharacterized protein n=1 Tax=Paspalum notatum var. saurae TaxID=547442 RepID=A0AAQ3T3D2_PASNO